VEKNSVVFGRVATSLSQAITHVKPEMRNKLAVRMRDLSHVPL
jgi:hypothetical protein